MIKYSQKFKCFILERPKKWQREKDKRKAKEADPKQVRIARKRKNSTD